MMQQQVAGNNPVDKTEGRKGERTNEFPMSRLPATPGTSGRPRMSPAKKKPLDSLPEIAEASPIQWAGLEKLRALAQQQAKQAKAHFAVCKKATGVRLSELWEQAKTRATKLQSQSGELREKAQVKAAELWTKAKDFGEVSKAAVQTEGRDWIEEVRQVGCSKHPAPLVLTCFFSLLFIFIGCSLASTWPVNPRAPQMLLR